MNLTIKQLRAFVAVAELQSFGLAAERLSLTTGAVSLLVRDLEAEVGFSLFDRTTRRVALSKAGSAFLPSAEQVLKQVQSAVITAHDVRNRTTGIVRVAAPLVVAHAILPNAVAAYQQQHPNVTVRPVDCAVEGLVRVVEEDHADMAIGPDRPPSSEVQRMALYESPWVLWCAPRHRLARRRHIDWAMLKEESVVTAGRDYETRLMPALQGLSEADRFVPNYVVDNITTALGIAKAGLGVTLSPMYVGHLAHELGLVMKPLRAPEITREFSLYLPARRSLSPAAEAVSEFLKSHLRSDRLTLS